MHKSYMHKCWVLTNAHTFSYPNPYEDLQHYHCLQKVPSCHFPVNSTFIPRGTTLLIFFHHVQFFLFCVYKWNRKVCTLLCNNLSMSFLLICILFHFILKWLQIYPNLFICSLVNEYYFLFLTIINTAAMNFCVQVFVWTYIFTSHFLDGSDGKESACSAGDTRDMGLIPGREHPLEKEMATHSSILAWTISWTEETGRLQSMGSQGARQD